MSFIEDRLDSRRAEHDSAGLAATANPTGFNASTMHEQLTYGLDAANNRSTHASETSAGTTSSTYYLVPLPELTSLLDE